MSNVGTVSPQVQAEYEEYRAEGRVWGQIPIERIRKIKYPRATKAQIEAFLHYEDLSTTVSDVLDSLGLRGAVAGSHLPSLIPGSRIVGTATTVRSIPEARCATSPPSRSWTIRSGPRA